MDGVVGYDVEGLEVEAGAGDDNTPRLAAQRCDAVANQLQQNPLVFVFQPPRVEPFVRLMIL